MEDLVEDRKIVGNKKPNYGCFTTTCYNINITIYSII